MITIAQAPEYVAGEDKKCEFFMTATLRQKTKKDAEASFLFQG